MKSAGRKISKYISLIVIYTSLACPSIWDEGEDQISRGAPCFIQAWPLMVQSCLAILLAMP